MHTINQSRHKSVKYKTLFILMQADGEGQENSTAHDRRGLSGCRNGTNVMCLEWQAAIFRTKSKNNGSGDLSNPHPITSVDSKIKLFFAKQGARALEAT